MVRNYIAGCARDSQSDYLQFFHIAFGSLRELRCQVGLSKRLGFMCNQDSEQIELNIVETEKILNRALKVDGRV